MLTMLEFMQNRKWLILLCCLLSVGLTGCALFRKKRAEAPPVSFLLYGVHLLWLALGIFWASSGKFFLREFSKQLFALPLILYVFLLMPRKEAVIRKLIFVMSAVGALYAILSVDIASVGVSRGLLNLIPGFSTALNGYEAGTRLTGIFSNGNISAGLLSICVFLSLYLLESAENRRERVFAAVFAALQAETLLLNFSLGATGFFLISAVVYLVFSGEKRGSVFFRMLEIALPVLVSVFLSVQYFEVSDGRLAIPLISACLSAAAAAVLELAVYPRLVKIAEGWRMATTWLLIAVMVLVCVYGAAAFLVRGSAELVKGQSLRRSCYPPAGSYTLAVQAEGAVNVRISSQNEQEVITHANTQLYSGAVEAASFEVPEDSKIVHLTFSSPEGAVLKEAELVGAQTVSLHLGYPLLPGFVSNRLQGLLANENAIQRTAFFRDGMKIFRDHPILGAGLGSFETLLFGYQEFYYETKYVHNHYIQTLLDSGIIGLLIYLALLAATAAALWRGRRKDAPYRRLHPALCAAFVMILLHSVMEVVMSTSVYLPYALVVLSLASVCFGSSLKKPAARYAASVLPGVTALAYAVLIILNMSADSAVKKSTDSAVRFFDALEYAISVDVFEKNDWMISYISTCSDYELNAYRKQANRYAEKLMDVPSNSLHQHLIRYYLVFGEYDRALTAALRSAHFNYSDSSNWNESFAQFSSALSSHPDDEGLILLCVRDLNQELEKYQERLLVPVKLNAVSKVIVAAALNEE